MIYLLITAAFIIIFFTNQISNINRKDKNNWLDDLLVNNYKLFIGLLLQFILQRFPKGILPEKRPAISGKSQKYAG